MDLIFLLRNSILQYLNSAEVNCFTTIIRCCFKLDANYLTNDFQALILHSCSLCLYAAVEYFSEKGSMFVSQWWQQLLHTSPPQVVMGCVGDQLWSSLVLIYNISVVVCGLSVLVMPFIISYCFIAVAAAVFGLFISAIYVLTW